MQHTIAPERLQAAQSSLASIRSQSRVWELTHPETGCLCRAEFHHDGLLTVEIVDGPPGLDTNRWWDEDLYDDAVAEAENDLAKRGLLRTHVPTPEAALRELRLLADAADIREVV